MSQPLLGQIAIFGFNFAPAGWAFCQGQVLAIEQNTALFSVLGNTYGGDGHVTFALPNLQGVPVGAGASSGGSNRQIGETGGEMVVTLSSSQIPSHRHPFNAVTSQATSVAPAGGQLAKAWKQAAHTDNVAYFYSTDAANAHVALAPGAILPSGQNRPHNNLQPFLTLNFCIATSGEAPPQPGAPPAAARDPYVGELAICAFGNTPAGWLPCDGRILPVIQNQQLFSLLGISYGGDGIQHFALPDLRGRVPFNFNSSFPLGMRGGEEAHVLTEAELPSHSHALMANAAATNIGNTPSPSTVLCASSGKSVPDNTAFTALLYSTAVAGGALAGPAIGPTGLGQAHMNMMPSLALNFCICQNGAWPGG